MSDFILLDKDYIDYIKSDADLVMFNRMKELMETELHKPANECIQAVIEFDNLSNTLEGLPLRKFIIQGNPKLN